MRNPHHSILSALTLARLLLFTGCGQQSDIPHPVIAMPGEDDHGGGVPGESGTGTPPRRRAPVYRMLVPTKAELEAQIASVAKLEDASETWVTGDERYYSFAGRGDGDGEPRHRLLVLHPGAGFSPSEDLPDDAAAKELARAFFWRTSCWTRQTRTT